MSEMLKSRAHIRKQPDFDFSCVVPPSF